MAGNYDHFVIYKMHVVSCAILKAHPIGWCELSIKCMNGEQAIPADSNDIFKSELSARLELKHRLSDAAKINNRKLGEIKK